MNKGFLVFILGLLRLLPCTAQETLDQSAKSPNIIIILVDDLGYQDVGFNGCLDIPTPNIDRIASEGVAFTSAYVSYPVCGPSRAGLITGRYQDRFGFGRNPLFAPNDSMMGLPRTEETLAEVLKKANYKSVAIGKWHLGAHSSLRPLNRGFDDFFGFLSGGHSYFPELWKVENEYEVSSQFEAYHTKLLRNNSRVEEKEYLTDALSREAVHYIDKYKDQPFFMYLAYNAPHAPLQATQKYLDRFDAIKNPERKTYAAMVSAVDDGVGKILYQLEALNLDENTLLFFLSDNGGPERTNASDNGILRGGKSDLFEGGVRVPFTMKWPSKIPKTTAYKKPIISLDIFATAIAQVQESPPTKNQLDGVNLIPYILKIQTEFPHDYLFWRKFDKQDHATRNAAGDKILASKNQMNLFNLEANISEDRKLIKQDSLIFLDLKNAYQNWEAQLLHPIFMGLKSDSLYSKEHPYRFEKPGSLKKPMNKLLRNW